MGVREVARLDRELEDTLGARPRDPAACADVLARAAFACHTDPAAAKRWVEAELLDELVDCYEALGRFDEAITVMRRALQVGWSGQPDGRCRIAELLMRDGRVEQATEIWEQVKADTPDDVWLYNNAGLEYADIDDAHPSSPELLIGIPHLVAVSTLAGGGLWGAAGFAGLKWRGTVLVLGDEVLHGHYVIADAPINVKQQQGSERERCATAVGVPRPRGQVVVSGNE